MGIRYVIPYTFDELEDMPSATATRLRSLSIGFRQGVDRGVVRNHNDGTMDNRASKFRDWLYETAGYDFQSILRITRAHAPGLLGLFIRDMAKMPWNRKGDLRMTDTLLHFLTAATAFLREVVNDPHKNFLIHTHKGPKAPLIPFIADVIDQHCK